MRERKREKKKERDSERESERKSKIKIMDKERSLILGIVTVIS